jgi:hypothetical protein
MRCVNLEPVTEVWPIDANGQPGAHRAEQAGGAGKRHVGEPCSLDFRDGRLRHARAPRELGLRPSQQPSDVEHRAPNRDGSVVGIRGLPHREVIPTATYLAVTWPATFPARLSWRHTSVVGRR